MVVESIYVVFNKYFDDESKDEEATDEKKNMQEPIQSLEDIKDKQVELIEDSQPDFETNAQDLERQPEHVVFDTPTKDPLKQVRTSSLNDTTPSILRRRFKLSSQHPPENYHLNHPCPLANHYEINLCHLTMTTKSGRPTPSGPQHETVANTTRSTIK